MKRRTKAILAGSVVLAVLAVPGVLVFLRAGIEAARQEGDLSRVRSLLVVLRLYAHDYGGAFPDDLGVAFEQGYCASGRIYVSDGSPTRPPAGADELRAGQCDYLYYGKGLTLDRCSPETVILMTRPGVRKHGYVSLGFADCRVEGRRGPPLMQPAP